MERDPIEGLDEALERFTRKAFTRIVVALARTVRKEELGVPQIAILQMVNQGPLRLAELQEELALTQPTTSRLVDELVRRGLLHRAEAPEDRRAKRVEITTAGRRLLARIGVGRVGAMKQFAASLTPEDRPRAEAAMRALLRLR